jgi:hypothetical protein
MYIFDNRYLRPTYDEDLYRRQAALERYRRQQEELRQRDAWRQLVAYQESQERRRMQKIEQSRRGRQRQDLQNESSSRHTQDTPIYEIVRGRDGQLYRVRAPTPPARDRTSAAETTGKPKPNSVARGPDGRFYRANDSDSLKADDELTRDKTFKQVVAEVPVTRDTTAEKRNKTAETAAAYVQESNLTSYIVEDASDSEYEDESPLDRTMRNRLPSPGQWMEPVEVAM